MYSLAKKAINSFPVKTFQRQKPAEIPNPEPEETAISKQPVPTPSDDVHFDDPNAALWTSSARGDVDLVEKILRKYKVDPNFHKETLGYTCLMAASFNGHAKVAEVLINHKADVNALTEYGVSALIAASVNGRDKVADLLLRRQAHVNHKVGETGDTALHFAARQGHDELVVILIRYGADVRQPNKDSKRPADVAYNKLIRGRLIETERRFYYNLENKSEEQSLNPRAQLN